MSTQPADLHFTHRPTDGGYIWWYLDAISDDGKAALTLIAFIGSVFSPYYRRAGWRRPVDHCAVNIALYGPRRNYWAMTERGAATLDTGPTHYALKASRIDLDAGGLSIDINERAAPLPVPIRGHIRVDFGPLFETAHRLDRDGRHHWRPIAPRSRAAIRFPSPELDWTGDAYVDSNWGTEPLEAGFRRWDWSRADCGDDSAILYSPERRDGSRDTLALLYRQDGRIESFDPPAEVALDPGRIWRAERRTRAEALDPIVKETVEDTPFYTRSVIETRLLGQPLTAMHESLDLDRFKNPIVQRMLPFRMPRGWWFG